MSGSTTCSVAAQDISTAPLPPGPRYSTPFQYFREVKVDPLEFYRNLVKEYGDLICVRMWPRNQVLTVRPEHTRHILMDNPRNYPKGILFDRLKVIGGNGLFFSEGELWKKQRRLIMPSFRRGELIRLVPHMTQGAVDFADRMRKRHIDGAPFDTGPAMAEVAMDIACRAFFGEDILDRALMLHQALNAATEYGDYVMNHLFTPPLWLPTALNRRTRRALDTMYGTIDDLIRDNRSRGDADNVLYRLNTLVDAGEMSAEQLRDEMWTLLNAGHETTATTLGFAFYLLSEHPEALRRVHAEADALGGRPPGFDSLKALAFTERVVRETLRLYPPAWSTGREVMQDDLIDGYRIPKKSFVNPLFYLTQRHTEFWDEPDRFDPDRFLPERSQGRPPEAFSPFGLGGRRCIGEHFALMESTIVLATLSQRFELRLVPGHPVEPMIMGGPIRPRHGIQMTLHHRNNA